MNNGYILLVPIDIINDIINNYDYDETHSMEYKLNFCFTCSTFYKYVQINSFNGDYVNNTMMRHIKLRNITKFYSSNNNIDDISYLSCLTHLSATHDSNIGQNNIINMHDLSYLNMFQNYQISDVSHLSLLRTLNAGGYRNDFNNINDLINLTSLDISYNRAIINISCLTSLTILKATTIPALIGIEKLLNITKLDISYNKNFLDISLLTKLLSLKIRYSNIHQTNIDKLSLLTKLNDYGNTNINNIDHLTNLKVLNIGLDFNRIKQDSINSLSNLVTLRIYDNKYVNNIMHLRNLKTLDASGISSEIKQDSINNLFNLTNLNICNNKHITTISHLTNLQKLDISGQYCRINQFNIMKLYALVTIDYAWNNNIINVTHLTNLRNKKVNRQLF